MQPEIKNLYMKKETLLNTGYLKNWSIFEVCKEYAQNHVFALQHLNAEGIIKHDGTFGIWEDNGKGFGLECFLMGVGQQKNIESAPGENSEGMKVSLMVALRENKKTWIEIPGYTVIPELIESKLNKQEKELTLNIYNNARTKGVKFVIECDKETFNNANNSFGFLLAKTTEQRELFNQNSVIKNLKENSLFINGVKINTNVNMMFSYNLIGKNLSNRDRNAVDMQEINNHLWATIINNTNDKDIIIGILKNANNNILENINVYYWRIQNRSLWHETIEEYYNKPIDKICFATGSKSDARARYRKFKVIPTPNNSMKQFFNSFGIYSSEEIAPSRDINKMSYVQLKNLTELQHGNLKRARNLIQKHYTKIYYKIRYVDNLEDEYGNKVNGLCQYNEEQITLDINILNDFNQTFKTLLHECVHMVSHASDCSEEFEREWANACLAFALGTERAKRK